MEYRRAKASDIEGVSLDYEVGVSSLNGQIAPAQLTTTPNLSKYEVGIGVCLYNDVYKMGKACAVESRALKISPDDLQPGIEHAKAMAQETHRELFNPSEQPADQLRDSEFKKLLAEREEAELMGKYAAADLAELEKELAGMAYGGNPPVAPSLYWQLAAGAVIALTVAVALHDQVFRSESEAIAWAYSFGVGLLCGWFVVSLILYDPKGNADPTVPRKRNWFGLIAGVVFGLAFLGVRISPADDLYGVWVAVGWFALGMTVLEIAVVIGLHTVAERYHEALHNWQAHAQPAARTAAAIEVVKKHYEDYRQRQRELNEEVEQYISYVDERQVRHNHREEIEALVVTAYTHGYSDGVASNVGDVRQAKKGRGK